MKLRLSGPQKRDNKVSKTCLNRQPNAIHCEITSCDALLILIVE